MWQAGALSYMQLLPFEDLKLRVLNQSKGYKAGWRGASWPKSHSSKATYSRQTFEIGGHPYYVMATCIGYIITIKEAYKLHQLHHYHCTGVKNTTGYFVTSTDGK
jgi:hypothetical protein